MLLNQYDIRVMNPKSGDARPRYMVAAHDEIEAEALLRDRVSFPPGSALIVRQSAKRIDLKRPIYIGSIAWRGVYH